MDNNNLDLYKSLFRENFSLLSSIIHKIQQLENTYNTEEKIKTKINQLKEDSIDKDLYKYLVINNTNNLNTLNKEIIKLKSEKSSILKNITQNDIDSDFVRFYNKKKPTTSTLIVQTTHEWSALYNYNLKISSSLMNVLRRNILPDMDTLVVACNKPENVKKIFEDQKEWYSVRIDDLKKDTLKYLALYQASPTSAITHIDEIDKIVDSDEEGMEGYKKIILKGNPDIQEYLEKPLKLGIQKNFAPQNPRYTSLDLIKNANNLDDIFL